MIELVLIVIDVVIFGCVMFGCYNAGLKHAETDARQRENQIKAIATQRENQIKAITEDQVMRRVESQLVGHFLPGWRQIEPLEREGA